jgi:hypothetical protein
MTSAIVLAMRCIRGLLKTESEAASARPLTEAHLKAGLPARMIPKSGVRFSDKDHAPRKREAERRKAHAIHCPRLRKQVYAVCATRLSARKRAKRSALAFRRSRRGTRHAGRNQHWLSPGPCFPGLSLRQSRLSVLHADRSWCRPNGVQSRPGAGVTSPRARAPHPAPSVGVTG